MAGNLTIEQIREKYRKAMGEELGEAYLYLENTYTYLVQLFNEFMLFYNDEKNLELLGKSGHFFFFIIQKAISESIFMSLARLLDPAKSNGYSNLSLASIIPLVNNKKVQDELRSILENVLIPDSEFVKEARRKLFAHSDFNVLMGREELEYVPKSSKEDMERLVKNIRFFFRVINQHYFNSMTIYHFEQPNASKVLMARLTLAEKANQFLFRCQNSGLEIPEEFLDI